MMDDDDLYENQYYYLFYEYISNDQLIHLLNLIDKNIMNMDIMMIYELFEYDEENLYDVYKLHYIIYI
jgi:hypothetical protein